MSMHRISQIRIAADVGGTFTDLVAVANDVRNERVSREAAERDYGVVLVAGTWDVDVTATSARRSR